ncbi:MAG: class I SAM-dependent methyltransferase [Ferrovibrio sp.]|uniref:class I SAM-dependent methyltransferase n=1 Tax=Ferrovibrio sp. TaxID=1917215 RepID=UPI00391D311F
MTADPDNKQAASVMERAEYLKLSYDPVKAPFTSYPAKLAKYVGERWFARRGRLLDIGCGRGEFLSAFASLGYGAVGIDISPAAPDFAPEHEVHVANLETDPLPVPANSFDHVYSKSVIEHLRNPDAFLAKAFAALVPGGDAVIMTPSWIHNAWGPFYIDHTHVTPFTGPSLEQAMQLAGFENVRVIHFYQLPSVWRWPAMAWICRLIAWLPLPFRPMHPTAPWPNEVNKFIRFSNEVMLLAYGTKPSI